MVYYVRLPDWYSREKQPKIMSPKFFPFGGLGTGVSIGQKGVGVR